MATEAAIGHGTIFAMATIAAPGDYVNLAEVTSVKPPPVTRDIIDATHMQSPGKWREFISGLKDGGECTLDLNFVPGGATSTRLELAQTEEEPSNCKITFPNGAVWYFAAYCTGYEPEAPVDDKMTASVTFKVTGAVEFQDPS